MWSMKDGLAIRLLEFRVMELKYCRFQDFQNKLKGLALTELCFENLG